jgi:Zn-dependent peptidase ImmA (M78 family)
MPDTALISVNPDLTRDNDGLLLGTLAHELGHAIFDVPAWRTVSCQNTLPGLLGEPIHRVFRAVTTDEQHLTGSVRKAGERDFGEWRANEFMGSLLVPRDLLAARLRHHAPAIGIPLEARPAPGLLASVAAASRLADAVDRRFAFAISILLHRLAEDFGVSLKFIQVRLLRYGLATGEQLGMASEERRSQYGPGR